MQKGRQAREAYRFQGVIAAAVSPRRAQEHTIDLGAMLELVDFLGSSGIGGILLLGSAGEFVHFSLEDRRHMVNLAAKRSRLPLLVNVSHSTLDGAIALARDAADSGAAGVSLMPPYYYRYGQAAIRSFYLGFAQAIGAAAPIYLVNAPAFTNEIQLPAAADLLSTGLFAGLLDAAGGLPLLRALADPAGRAPSTLLAGDERTYTQAWALGTRGIVSGVASAVPELLLALERALATEAADQATRLQARLVEFLDSAASLPFPAAIKAALEERKLKTGVLPVPLGPESERALAGFQHWFRAWLPEVLRTSHA